jgi:hypothetical protein
MGAIIAGSLNVLGLNRVIITGNLTELPPSVVEYLSHAIQRGSMWARFGKVTCAAAPRRRAAGLAGVGLDRLLVPSAHGEGLRPRVGQSAGNNHLLRDTSLVVSDHQN